MALDDAGGANWRGLRVAAPLADPVDVASLSDLGVAEVYCGVGADGQHRLNRRPILAANLDSFSTLEAVVAECSQLGMTVSYTLNEPSYSDERRKVALNIARRAVESGVNALIVADTVLLEELAGWGIRLHLSSTANVTNAAAVGVFADLGIARVILPRHLTIGTIAGIAMEWRELEIEVITMGDPCPWDDGLCGFEHDLAQYTDQPECAGGACRKSYHIQVDGSSSRRTDQELKQGYGAVADLTGCGLCALGRLQKSGVSVLKTTGRGKPAIRDLYVKYLVEVLDSLGRAGEAKLSDDRWNEQVGRQHRAEMIAEWAGGRPRLTCDPPWSCYWPEIYSPGKYRGE